MWLRRRRSVGGRRVLTLFVKRDARIFCHAHAVPSHFGLFASSPLWPSCWCMLHSQCCYTNLHVRERDRYTIHCGIQHLSHVSSHGKRKRWAVSCAVASCWGERRRRQPPPPKKRHPPTKPQHLVILEKGKMIEGKYAEMNVNYGSRTVSFPDLVHINESHAVLYARSNSDG